MAHNPSPYRLNTPPPRNWTVPIVVVARGRRLRMQGGDFLAGRSDSPTPTEPASSPLNPGRALHRTYAIGRIDIATAAGEEQPSLARETDTAATALPEGNHIGPAAAARGEQQPLSLAHKSDIVAASRMVSQQSVDLPEGNQDAGPASPIIGHEIGAGIFSSINVAELNLRTFNPPQSFDDYIRTRVQLDSSDGGLTANQFREFIQCCRGCKRFMMSRSKDQHRCPGRNALPTQVQDGRGLFSLLDSTGGGQGLTRIQLRRLLVRCPICKLVFTRSAAAEHTHISDDTSSNSDA